MAPNEWIARLTIWDSPDPVFPPTALFTLYFMVADFLPSVRLSALGVWDVKRARIIRPSRSRNPR